MCGRLAYFGNGTFGYETLLLPDPPSIEDHNIPPSRNILAIRNSPETNNPSYTMLHFGAFGGGIAGTGNICGTLVRAVSVKLANNLLNTCTKFN